MANVAGTGGAGGKNIFDAKPAPKPSPPPRGGKPVTFPGPHNGHGIAHDVGSALHTLIHGTGGQTAQQFAAAHHTRAVGAPLFTPLSLGVDQLLHAPKIVGNAHRLAVDIAHPSRQHPPSLKQNAEGLLSGAFGVPFAAVGKNGEVVPPKVPKGRATPETAGELGQQVREGLRGASAARKEQDKLYSVTRGARAARGAAAAEEAGGGIEGYRAKLGQLKGELPKLEFKGMANFDDDGVKALLDHIEQHPTLQFYDKLNAQTALLDVLSGKVPTNRDRLLLEHVFGKEVSARVISAVPTIQQAKRLGLELWNLPRSLMASFDLSAPFRQALVVGATHPRIFFRNFGPMIRAARSEDTYHAIMGDIANDPMFLEAKEAGISFTNLGPINQREEQFLFSNLAERIPVAGRGVAASSRAYTGFLNKVRFDLFKYLAPAAKEAAAAAGRDEAQAVKDIASVINSSTGRGKLFSKHIITLNNIFFSPRLAASRLDYLNPVYYAKLDPFARKELLKGAIGLTGVVSTILYLAKMGGAKVNTDPRNADFAKIKIGNTRIDIAGGFQQYIRLAAQLSPSAIGGGKIISSTTGKTLTLGPQGPGHLSRFDIGIRFLEQKLAPSPSLVVDLFKGTDFADKPFSWKRAAYQRMIPLLAQDASDLYKEGGLGAAVGGYALGGFGIGIQTYAPKPPKSAKAKSGSSNIFSPVGTSSGGGGKNIFDKKP